MQVAESKGLPKLKYHLLPRTKGFWVTVQNLRGTGEQWEGLHALANQMISWLTDAMFHVQLQLCTTPAWTSETTRHRLYATFWMERNITPTYMWGRVNCFGFQDCYFQLPFWGICFFMWEILLPLWFTGEYHWRWSQKVRQNVLLGSTNSIRRRLGNVKEDIW